MQELIKKQNKLNEEYVDTYPEGVTVAEKDKLDLDAIVILAKEGYYKQALHLAENLDTLVRDVLDEDFLTELRRKA